MIKYLVVCFLLTTIAGSSVRGSESRLPDIASYLVRAGLALDGLDAAPADAAPGDAAPVDAEAVDDKSTGDKSAGAAPDPSKPCAGVSFSRKLKYGESDLNVLDVATGDSKDASPRPVLLFVAGESFAGDNGAPDAAGSLQDQAMCFAARHD